MLTKYFIEIDRVKTEIPKECVKNWDEVKCAYKRSDYSGITRSFTTQFEFVGEAYDLLMDLYLQDGFNASAILSLYTITDRWEWEERFACPLDFSSIVWDGSVIKINCLDNSLAALIKANKSTKYEFKIGEDLDLEADKVFAFNRLPIQEGLTYEFSGGESDETDGSLRMPAPENNRLYMGVLSDELITVGGSIEWNDDQSTDPGSYLMIARKPVRVTLDYSIEYDQCYGSTVVSAYIRILRASGKSEPFQGYGSNFAFGSAGLKFCGYYNSAADLRNAYPHDKIYINGAPQDKLYAVVNGSVWRVVYKGSGERTDWEDQRVDLDTFKRRKAAAHGLYADLEPGDKVFIECSGGNSHVYTQNFTFGWMARGNGCFIDAFNPEKIGSKILAKMCQGHINAKVTISDFDPRLANTYILAAESIRNIPGAKLYSSFNEFCDWMSAVFGYTYYLGDSVKSKYVAYKKALSGSTNTPYPIEESEPWQANNGTSITEEDILYMEAYGKFVAYDGHKWFRYFPGHEQYNDPATGYARIDTIFQIKRWHNGTQKLDNYYFVMKSDGTLNTSPIRYTGDIDDIRKSFQNVIFVHRSEIFNPEAPVRKIDHIRDTNYSVENGQIFASIEIGYDKKDYENINGRDEFNFSNIYTTGYGVTDKKLTLKSKYRADCYGIEFTAQKRGSDTTDTNSDNNVFFVYCKDIDNVTVGPDTSAEIVNAISADVFNGVFSPLACVAANAGYIGMQSKALHLEFASSTGNSGIVIDSQPMNGNIDLTSPLMTCGILEFTTDDVKEPADFGDLVEVVSSGIIYRGFVQEATFKYAKNESVKYKLIVKDIEL